MAAILGCYFRLYPILFPTSSSSEEKAAAMVVMQTRTNIAKNVDRLYPGLDPAKKQAMVNEQFSSWSQKNRPRFQKLIFNLSQKIYRQDILNDPKAQAPEMYLPDSDSYYFYGLTKDLIDGKKIMEKRKGAEYFNALMQAPIGYWEKINYHPHIGFLFYKLIHAFDPHISPMKAVSFTPIILTIISIFLFVFCCRSLMITPWITALGATFFALSPIFIRRTFFGWYDNDVYNVLFPLLITLLVFLGIESFEHTKKRSLLAILTGVSIATYAYFWQGWVYMFCVVLTAGTVITGITFLPRLDRKQLAAPLLFFAMAFVITSAGIVASFGIRQFFFLFQEGWQVLNEFFSSSKLSLWPDIYLSVGELHRTTLREMIDLCGNLFWAIVVAAGAIFLFIDNLRSTKIKTLHKTIFLAIFFLSAMILTLKAQRFAVLLLVPFSLCGAYGLQKIFLGANVLISKIRIPSQFSGMRTAALWMILGILLLINPLFKASDWAMRIRPIFNEQWDKALTAIREKTPPDSIINAWWPPGHFIKAMAQRRVTFDGATINVPQAYWMAQALYSSDEKYTLGILRMLNTSANKATEYLLSQGFRLSQTIELIRSIVAHSQEKAQRILATRLTPEQAQGLLALTHGDPPPSYALIYNDMMETNIGIGFAARWNIKKIEEINEAPEILEQVRKMKREDFIDLLWNLQGGMLRYSQVIDQIGRHNDVLFFDNGITIDLSALTCTISSPVFGKGIPKALMYQADHDVVRKNFSYPSLSYVVVLFPVAKDRYACVLMDEAIADSILTRLFFFKAKGLSYITPFLSEQDMTGRTQLFVFDINWTRFKNKTEEAP